MKVKNKNYFHLFLIVTFTQLIEQSHTFLIDHRLKRGTEEHASPYIIDLAIGLSLLVSII